MKLTVNFSSLHEAVKAMGADKADFEIGLAFKDIDPIDAALRDGQELGKDIDLKEIDNNHGVLSYKGRHIMLYIPDQGNEINNVVQDGEKGKRIHIAECSKLNEMRETGKFPRYRVTNEINGYVPIYGIDPDTSLETKDNAYLKPCMLCLKVLNYQGYAIKGKPEKDKIFASFSFIKYFETYSSHFKSLPKSKVIKESVNYVPDWAAISSKVRSQVNYMCEQCGVDLQSVKRLLHAHHIDGVKNNNNRANLRVLCCDCHKKQPHHDHLYIKPNDILTINRLRKEQHKFDNSDYSQLSKYADTALEGLILKCEKMRLPIGELGISVQCGNVLVSFDLCWPRKKVVVLIDMKHELNAREQGWNVFSANTALQNFTEFQRYVR